MKHIIYRATLHARAIGIMVILLLLGLLTEQSYAQSKTIKGTVTDQKGEAVIGVTVVAKGTGSGTTTGAGGKFTITCAEKVTQLEFGFLGYKPKTVNITGAPQQLKVVMDESAETLEEVVVIGYGSMAKSDITGSVTRVSPDEVEAFSATSIQSLIQGRAAGVQVVSGDGAPGAALEMTIRGNSSLSAEAPLYVVDGIIMNSTLSDVKVGDDLANSAQNGLSGISPNDIENIEILKDASATAIYGALGAGGVVLITTKRGKEGRPRIEYSGGITFQTPAKRIDVLSFDEYATYQKTLRTIENKNFTVEDKIPIDWQDYIINDSWSQSHRLMVSGKVKGTNYYIAGGMADNSGIIKNSRSQSQDFRVNISQQITKALSVGTNSSLSRTFTDMAQAGLNGITLGMRTTAPFKPTKIPEDDPSITDEEDLFLMYGPMPLLLDYADYSEEYRIVSSLYADIKLNKLFSMRTTFGVDYRNKTRQQWNGPTNSKYKGIGMAAFGSIENLSYNIDHMFYYKQKINKHSMNLTAGVTYLCRDQMNYYISSSNFAGNTAGREEGIMYGLTTERPQYTKSQIRNLSFLARAIYNYNERYVFTATVRADGSSKFEQHNRFGFFPSLALAYRIDQTQFVKDNLRAISNLKLRVGWGLTGNENIAVYSTMPTFGSISLAEPDGSYTMGLYPNNIANQDLKWETSRQYNLGLDIGLFNNRLTMVVDVYDKMSTDLLQKTKLAPSNGVPEMSINRGSISNKGIEFSVDAMIVTKKNFTLNLGANITSNRNRITDIGLSPVTIGALNLPMYTGGKIGSSGTTSLVVAMIEGYSVSQFMGLKTNGIVQQAEYEADRRLRVANYLSMYPSANPSTLTDAELIQVPGLLPSYSRGGTALPQLLRAGDPRYQDTNKDGRIDSNDLTIIGNALPDFTYGFNINMTLFRKFNINAVFTGMYGNEVANQDRTREEDVIAKNGGNITRRAYYNRYTDENPSDEYMRYNYLGDNGNFLSRYIEDGSFLRLSSLSIAYNHTFKKRHIIRGFQVNLTGRNLFCITNFTGYDPEVSSFANNPNRAGISWGAYPRSRSFILGLNLNF